MQPCDYDAAVGRPAADRSAVPPPSERETGYIGLQVWERDRVGNGDRDSDSRRSSLHPSSRLICGIDRQSCAEVRWCSSPVQGIIWFGFFQLSFLNIPFLGGTTFLRSKQVYKSSIGLVSLQLRISELKWLINYLCMLKKSYVVNNILI